VIDPSEQFSTRTESSTFTFAPAFEVISRLFEGRIFKKIPIAELKNSAIFKKSSFKFAIGEKNYIFKTGSKQLSNFLNATS
jgi:hypothetical protein